MNFVALSAFVLIPVAFASGAAGYVGAEVCGSCHAANFTSQSRTAHAHALAPSSPPQPGDWAFGAGLQAITPVTRIGGDSYREDGLSWYRSLNGYAITLGQHDEKGVVFRTLDPGARFLTCFGCHSTGPLSLGKDEQIVPHELGVRCEVCHGPGAAHAAAPARNRLSSPAQMTAVGMNRFCGQCHRTDSETGEELTDLRDARNARDQPLRLAASACFLRSSGRLNCVTCHAPHQPLDQKPSSYDVRCQSCHANKVHRQEIAGQACVTCHMPRIPNGPNVTFANHRIAIYSPANPILPAGARVTRGLAFQPEAAGVRHVFEDALARREREYGATDPRTAQAARDLGMYLRAHKDTPGARRALAQALHIDDVSPGTSAPQTLEDAAALASVSSAVAAEPLWLRAAESTDPVLAGEALTSLGSLRKAAGDLAGAAACFRRALVKAEQADGRDGTPAELILKILVTLDRQAFGPRNEQTLSDARRLAALYRSTGRPREAVALEQQINGGGPR